MGIEKLVVSRRFRRAARPEHGGDAWRYPNVLDFSANVNPLGPSEKVAEAIRRALCEISSYPGDGAELRSALAERHGLNESCVVLGNGSSELIKAFCEVFLREGDVAVIPEPTFAEYGYFSRLYGARVVEAHPEVREVKKSAAKAVFLCNPNNPTGKGTPLERIEELAREAERAGFLLLVDEAYIEFSRLKSASELVSSCKNLVVLRSMTKFYSIPGLRFGYALANPEVADCLRSVLPPWNVNTLAMSAALAALHDRKFAEESRRYLAREKRRLLSALERIPALKVYPSEANFFLINVKNTGMSSREIKLKLAERGLLIRDCSSFPRLGEEHIRVCVRRREENMQLVCALEELLNG
jgi:threonine-phosphate decarboxylase